MTEGKRKVIANVERLNQFMDKEGFSAVVVRSGKNFTYLAGFAYPGTLGRHLDFPDSPRGVLLVWPREGKPVMVLNSIAAPVSQRDSWIEDIEIYDDYSGSAYRKAAEVLNRMGIQGDKLGFEKSYLSAERWEEIQELLPRANIVDCTSMMDEVRWIKTPGEVELIKLAADILDDAYLEVFSTVREGDTEREVHSRIVKSCIQRGAQWAHGMLNSSRNTIIYGGEGDFTFRRGDIIHNDYVLYYLGYPGHQSRTAILGPPSEEQRRTYEAIRDMYRMTIEQCRAGVKASAVYQFGAEAIERQGYYRPPLVGHGVGAWWHQQSPYLVSNDHRELEAGMVLALEPFADYWHIQDMILVTDGSPELLSGKFSTDEMFVSG